MRGTQLLIRPRAFPSLASQSLDCVAVAAPGSVAGLCLIPFTVSKLLVYFLNYVIDFFFFPLPSG